MKPIGTPSNICKIKIIEIANIIVKKKYILTEERKNTFNDLLNYFLGKEGNLNLNKGIALIGNYGIGKSTIFQIFHKFLSKYFWMNPNMFRISSIEEVISEMNKNSFMESVILYNHKPNVNGINFKHPIHLLINEFGFKYNAKNYGTDVNELIDMFLMKRYDIFQQDRKLLHITTNYDINDFKNNFHERIIDRFREMFNIIELKGKSFRE